jgi:hypothetical protein
MLFNNQGDHTAYIFCTAENRGVGKNGKKEHKKRLRQKRCNPLFIWRREEDLNLR